MVLTSEIKFGGERMDHYFHSPTPSEREAMLLTGIHARVPGHLRSSTHDRIGLWSSGKGVPATCAAGSQKPASKQRATQELAPQDAGGQRVLPLHCTGLYKICGVKSVQERCTALSIICIDEDFAERLQLTASNYNCPLAGSTFADRTAKSLDLIGNTPLHEAAERYPADALRVFMGRHHRTYTDESPVCNAGPAQRTSLQHCNT